MELTAAAAATAQRLLEAFEVSGQSAGTGLASQGPGEVPPALAQQFSQLLESPPASETPSMQLAADPADASRAQPEARLMDPAELLGLQASTAMLANEAEYGNRFQQTALEDLQTILRQQS